MNGLASHTVARLRAAVSRERLLETAFRLIEVPSPTRSAGAVANRLEELLVAERFTVQRPEANWPAAPAVVARLESGQPGRTLQYNGHLDTVHLPFVPPRVEDGKLHGSGASDMKGGIAAAVEAMRALRDTGLLTAGGVLLTAHDLHETPWGDGTQVNSLIQAGYLGDGVLLPEYLSDRLPLLGRGLGVLEMRVARGGEPVHEVMGGIEQPNVIFAGAELVRRFARLDGKLASHSHPWAGRESAFIGQIHGGEIYNQSPTELRLSGTRRWLPGTSVAEVESEFHALLAGVAREQGVTVEGQFHLARDAYEISSDEPLVGAFQTAYQATTGRELPLGAKPFVDDGNAFVRQGGIPAITHGPNAKGAHTLEEEVPVDELCRVALVYALTAVAFCVA